MNYLGIEYSMKHAPKLDESFIPFGVWRAAYLKDAKMPRWMKEGISAKEKNKDRKYDLVD